MSSGGGTCSYSVGPVHPDKVQFSSAAIVKWPSNGTFEQIGEFAFKYQPHSVFKGTGEYGGSKSDDWNSVLVHQTFRTLFVFENSIEETKAEQQTAAIQLRQFVGDEKSRFWSGWQGAYASQRELNVT
jgi:hypothetical protein